MRKARNISASRFRQITALLSPFASRSTPADADQIDWQELYQFCEFHGIRPWLARVLDARSLAYHCPAWLTAKLAEFGKGHAFSVLAKTAEIVSIAQALDAAGIGGIFFKGAVLGKQIYDGPNSREFNDIDILVSSAEKNKVADILKSLKYYPLVGDKEFRRIFCDYIGQHMFRHLESDLVVDLHWNFVGENPFPIDCAEALRNGVGVQLGGTTIPAPGIDDLSLILAGHGQKEGWASFAWALDFAMFAAKSPDFDWVNAAARSKEKRSLRPLLSASLLVQHLFDHEIDHNLLAVARTKSEIVDDVERVVARYHVFQRRILAEDLMGPVRLCDTAGQRMGVWFRLLTTRTTGDYAALPLPSRWWWVYRFTRVVRLVGKNFRRTPRTSSVFFESYSDS